jgi:hypothetical protein
MPTIAIALIVVGGVWALVMLGLFGLGVAFDVYRGMKGRSSASPTSTAPTHSYSTTNGLVTVHYPADFAAKNLDATTVSLSKNFIGGQNEAVTIAAVPHPISNDVREIARLLHADTEKEALSRDGTYTHTDDHAGNCLGVYRGWEVNVSYNLLLGGIYLSKSCFFLVDNTVFELRYDVPSVHAKEETPLL